MKTDIKRAALRPDGTYPDFVFISYCHDDADRVVPIIRSMQNERVCIWYDSELKGGEDYNERIFNMIYHCRAFCMMLTEGYLHSDYCRRELNYAKNKNKILIPVFLDNYESMDFNGSRSIEACFSHDHAIFCDRVPEQQYLQQILDCEGVKACICKSAVQAPVKTEKVTGQKTSEKQVVQTSARDELPEPECEPVGLEQPSAKPEKKTNGGGFHWHEIGAGRDEITKIYVQSLQTQKLVYVSVASGVTKIGDGAFEGLKKLQKVLLPDSCTSIGKNAFADCRTLSEVYTGQLREIGEGAFKNCAINDLKLPDTIEKIGATAFDGLSSAFRVTIPAKAEMESLLWLYSNRYATLIECSKEYIRRMAANPVIIAMRENILLTDGTEEELNAMVKPNIELSGPTERLVPHDKTRICRYEYSGRSDVDGAVIIPETVKTIEEGAFRDTGITHVRLPRATESIGDHVFSKTGIASLWLPDCVRKVGRGWNECEQLTELVIGSPYVEFAYEDQSGFVADFVHLKRIVVAKSTYDRCFAELHKKGMLKDVQIDVRSDSRLAELFEAEEKALNAKINSWEDVGETVKSYGGQPLSEVYRALSDELLNANKAIFQSKKHLQLIADKRSMVFEAMSALSYEKVKEYMKSPMTEYQMLLRRAVYRKKRQG